MIYDYWCGVIDNVHQSVQRWDDDVYMIKDEMNWVRWGLWCVNSLKDIVWLDSLVQFSRALRVWSLILNLRFETLGYQQYDYFTALMTNYSIYFSICLSEFLNRSATISIALPQINQHGIVSIVEICGVWVWGVHGCVVSKYRYLRENVQYLK